MKPSEAFQAMVSTWTVETSDGPRNIQMSSVGVETIQPVVEAMKELEDRVEAWESWHDKYREQLHALDDRLFKMEGGKKAKPPKAKPPKVVPKKKKGKR